MSRLKDRETEEEAPVIQKGGISDRENSMCKDSEAREYSMFRGTQRRSIKT